MIANGFDVAVIENHVNGNPFVNTYSEARYSYYGGGGTPNAWFDGTLNSLGGLPSGSMYSYYLPLYNQRIAIPSNFTISMNGSNNGLNYTVLVNIENVEPYAGSNLVLQFVLTESHIPHNWGSLTEANHVNRFMAPDQNGTPLDFSGSSTQSVTLEFSVDPSWVIENCEVVAFVQDNSSKEILQGIKMSVDALPPLTADFSADNLTPGIGETVNFTDLSTNSPNAWDWSFTPSTVTYVGGTSSTSQNPQVQFNSDGFYTVLLTATNVDGSDSEVKLNYISVIGPTVADFTADVLAPGIGQTVSFTDLSSYDPISWSWSFNPATVTFVGGTNSSSQNPQVQFNSPELYTVSLTATNIYGSDTEIKLNYIDVSLYCPASGATQYIEITRVQLETIDNETGQDYYSNFTYLSTDLTQDQSYDITVTNGDNYPDADLSVWIDWDQDGIFNSSEENVVCEVGNGGQGTYNFTVPVAAITGTTRMRVRTKYNGDDCGVPCGTTTYGEVEDYSVNVISGIVPPVANFVADNVTPTIGETVDFTDLSTNSPTSWAWTFNPSTITYVGFSNSTSQNPQVQFDEAGDYTVSLVATNGGGGDSETKLNYIHVTIPYIDLELTVFLEGPYNGSLMDTDLAPVLPLNQSFNIDPWYYTGTESVVSIPGADIVDWVLVELRDATSGSLADETASFDWQAAFIRNDGKVVNLNGDQELHFESTVSNSLFVVMHHMNHLSIMTASGVNENGGMYSYDFSQADGQAYGSGAQKLIGSGVWGMYGGDGNRDGTIDVLDRSPLWESEAGTGGYNESDFNLDGQTDNQDKNDCWLPNDGQSKQIPE